MKTNKTNLKSRIFAVMVSVMLLATCFMSTTAFAADAISPVFKFDKVLVMDENANVPNVDFTFNIAEGAAVPEKNISAGVVEGLTTTATVSFSTEDLTAPATDGYKTATKTASFDFTNVAFTKPGIYRYVITETEGTDSGITYDPTERYLDVYVQNKDGGGFEIFGFVMYASIDDDTKLGDDDAAFTNEYTTYDLDLKKVVAGNQGDKNMNFNFTIKITGATAGTQFTVNGAEGSEHVLLTANSDGNAEGTYALKNNETVTVYGLTTGMDYQIVEDDYSAKGYETAYVVNNESSAEGRDTGVKDITTTNTVTFTNTKNGTVPTGILLETAPYMILGAVVLAGIVVLFVTRRRRSH